LTNTPENEQLSALSSLLESAGLTAKDFVQNISVLANAKKENIEKQKKLATEGKIFLNKEFIIPARTDVYIYQDNRTKNKNYYIRIWEPKTRKHFSQSLKTNIREIAFTRANEIYLNRVGRLNFGLNNKSITANELVQKYSQLRHKDISKTPKTTGGITEQSWIAITDRIRYYEKFVKEKGYKNTNIEDIPPDTFIRFGEWLKERRKESFKSGGARSNETINQIISAIKKMYVDIAITEKYITPNEFPTFKYLPKTREKKQKRDTIDADEFTQVSKWINYKYCTEEGITEKERIKRRIYGITHTIHHYTGMRPKELLSIRWCDISDVDKDKKGYGVDKVIHISSEVAKTGQSRDVIAPISNQLERLKKWYFKLGHVVDENSSEYVFLKCTDTAIRNNEPKTDIELTKRIKKVYAGADADEYIVLNGRNITNYSARHHFITQGLLRGVDIFTISLNAGTSVQYIEETYAKGLKTRMVSDELTKNLGIHRSKDDGSGEEREI
jgi:integrase